MPIFTDQTNANMIRTFKSALFLLFLVALVSSCQKEVSDQNAVTPTNNNNTTDCKACNYYPFCDQSTYTYVDTSATGAATTTAQTLSLVGDTTMDGKVFQKASTGAGSPISYHNCTSGITIIAGFPTPSNRVTTTILKANEPVNTAWTDVNTNAGQSFNYNWKIIAKDLTKTVLGTTYSSVIQVHLTVAFDFMGTTMILAESDYYYAPNVGLIDNITYDWTSGSAVMTLHRVLQSYHIP